MKNFRKVLLLVCSALLLFISTGSIALESSAGKDLTILFTHDLHSYFLPHKILTPQGEQIQQGGYARLAYLVKEQRLLNPGKILLVDAGDFSMGTLFHTSFLKEAFELRLMEKMGYEAVTLGNHDFDFHADGLAMMLEAAKAKSRHLPSLVASNVVFSKNDPGDAALKRAFVNYPVKDYTIIEKSGIRIGIFGIMGKDAVDDTPFAKPVTFSDPIAAAKRVVDILKNKEKVDMIICLSHSGTSPVKSKSEDELLAKAVPEIAVIISGHTHTVLPKPIMVGKTLIVSSGSYSEYLGVLKINYVKNINLKVVSYDLKNITSGIPEDKFIAAEIESYKKIVNRDFLSPYHLTYDQVIAYSDYNMESLASAYAEPREMGLGNLITDAYIYAVKNNEGKNYEHISLSLDALGLIRDSFQKGKITTADVFQVLSLGLGRDSIAGYPLVSFYLSGKELKDALEVQTTVAPLEKADAYLQVSGVKFSYNPHRIPFDRVTEVQVRDDQGIFKPLDHKKLYRICMNYYAAEMMNYVTKVTHGILKVQPKDKNGQAINDLSQTIIYMNKGTAKAEELKEWIALTQYLGSFGEGKGITRIPDKYRGPEGRYRAEPSWNPVKLIAGGNGITYGALFVGLFLLCVIGLVIRCAIKKVSPSRKPQ